MISGISSMSSYMGVMNTHAMQQRPDPEEVLNSIDSNGDGQFNMTELEAVTTEISEKTGITLDVNDVFSTYDTDGDGILSTKEMKSFLEDYRPPHEGDMAQQFKMQQAMSSYGMNMNESQISSLLDLLSTQSGDEDASSSYESENTYSSLNLIA